jgi:regulation of enolase protein 1 (concanavalin A-like superfamily)
MTTDRDTDFKLLGFFGFFRNNIDIVDIAKQIIAKI